MPDPWSILLRPYDQSIILFNGYNVRSAFSKRNLRSSKHKEERKIRWITDGLYYWTEDWPHICSVAPISGAEFDEDDIDKYSGKQAEYKLGINMKDFSPKLYRIVS